MFAVLRQDNFAYQLVYLLHIAAVIVAFASAFVHPRLGGLAKRLPGDAASALNQTMVDGSVKIHFPALALAGVLGVAMIPMSDSVYEFSDPWISVAFAIWFAMLAVLFLVQIPAERSLAREPGDEATHKKVAMFGGILHLLLVVMLIVMVWKPGV